MKTVFDSSAFAKRYITENGSERVDQICLETDELILCIITIPEIISALNKRKREQVIDSESYSIAKIQLLEDVGDATILNLSPRIMSLTIALLEKNTVRTLDALHVACALDCKADLFVSADKRQISAASSEGLNIEYIGFQHRK